MKVEKYINSDRGTVAQYMKRLLALGRGREKSILPGRCFGFWLLDHEMMGVGSGAGSIYFHAYYSERGHFFFFF